MNMMHDPSLDASVRQFKRQYFFSKFALNFFAIVYLLAGIGMLVVSFWLETEVFLTILGESPVISYLTAACLEAMKLGTIIVYDFIGKKEHLQPNTRTTLGQIKVIAQLLFKRFFQISLFLISMLCVATVISKRFDNPNLEQTKADDLAALEATYQRDKTDIITRQQQEKQTLAQQQQQSIADIDNRYEAPIANQRQGMDKERRNISRTGIVQGGKYDSYEKELVRLDGLKQAERNTQMTLLNQTSLAQTQRHSQELQQLNADYAVKQDKVKHNNYDQDFRVEHQTIKAIVKTLNAIRPITANAAPLEGQTFVAMFALMLSAIIECGIFLALSSFVAVFFPSELTDIELEMAAVQKKTSRYGLAPDTTYND